MSSSPSFFLFLSFFLKKGKTRNYCCLHCSTAPICTSVATAKQQLSSSQAFVFRNGHCFLPLLSIALHAIIDKIHSCVTSPEESYDRPAVGRPTYTVYAVRASMIWDGAPCSSPLDLVLHLHAVHGACTEKWKLKGIHAYSSHSPVLALLPPPNNRRRSSRTACTTRAWICCDRSAANAEANKDDGLSVISHHRSMDRSAAWMMGQGALAAWHRWQR